MPPKKNTVPNNAADLVELAHAGTPEAIEKLKKAVAKAKDEDEKGFAECALEECQYFYYLPNSEAEEREFGILKLIQKKEDELMDLENDLGGLSYKEGQLELEIEITEKLLKKVKDKKKIALWQENLKCVTEVKKVYQDDRKDIENDIEFLETWLTEARSQIKSEKYKNMPLEVLESIHDDYEDSGDCDGCEDCEC